MSSKQADTSLLCDNDGRGLLLWLLQFRNLFTNVIFQVDRLAALSLTKPVRVAIDPKMQVAKGITQEFVRIRENQEDHRDAILLGRSNTLMYGAFAKEATQKMPTLFPVTYPLLHA